MQVQNLKSNSKNPSMIKRLKTHRKNTTTKINKNKPKFGVIELEYESDDTKKNT